VGKLVKKFKETWSVFDKPRVGRTSVGDDIPTGVIAKFHTHSHWFHTFRTSCTTYMRKQKGHKHADLTADNFLNSDKCSFTY
jgi:hypothetical protein